MKLKYLITSLVLGSLVFASCEDEISSGSSASNVNKGKEKPTVAVEVKDHSDVDFTLTITPSEDVQNYAYVIFSADSYEYASVPSAYEIVTKSVSGTYASASIIKADETSQDVNIKCVLKDFYQVCVAAISKDGLLSEVDTMTVHIPGAHPDIAFVNATYTITPLSKAELADDAYDDPLVGTPFDVTIAEVEPAVYVLVAKWFGMFSLNLVGAYDYSDNTLTFDGIVYGKESDGSYFGYLVGLFDSNTKIWAIYGGGKSGTEPLVLQCTVADKKAKVSSIKSGGIEIDVHQYASGYPWLGVFGYFDEENTIEYKEDYVIPGA